MADPAIRLVGHDARIFMGDDLVQISGLDLSSKPDLCGIAWSRDGAFLPATDLDHLIMYGDGTGGPPFGLFPPTYANNMAPGQGSTLPHPGRMSRQRRRAAARAAAKERKS